MSPAQADQFFMVTGLIVVTVEGCATAGLWFIIKYATRRLEEVLSSWESKHG